VRGHASLCLSGKFRRGQAKPSESRLNSLDAPGAVEGERLYRIVDTVIMGARNEQQLRDNPAAAGSYSASEARPVAPCTRCGRTGLGLMWYLQS